MSITYLKQVGSFECVVATPEAGWIGKQGEKETPFVRVPVIVNEGPCKGQVAIWKGWLSDKAIDSTITRLKEVFGFDGDLVALSKGRSSLAGLPCNIETDNESYNGQMRLKVKWLNPPGGGGAKPLDAAEVDSILAKVSSKAKAIAKTVTKLPANTPPSTPPTPTTSTASQPTGSPPSIPAADDDDVPF